MKIRSHQKVTLVGLNQNRVLSECARLGVRLQNYKRLSHNQSQFVVKESAFDFLKSQGVLDGFEIKKTPVPSALYFLMCVPNRIGLLAGVLLVVLVSFYLSNTVLKIQVECEKPEQKEMVQAVLQKNGVTLGSSWKNVSLPKVEAELFSDVSGVGSVHASRNGCKLVVTLSASAGPILREGNLLALEDGTISQIVVSRGEAKKKKGDLVRAGEVIVQADESGMVAAEVAFTVYRQSSVSVQSQAEEWVPTGRVCQTSRVFWPWEKLSVPECECLFERSERQVVVDDCFVGMPFSMRRVTVVCKELEKRQVSEEEAKQRAENRARELATRGVSNVTHQSFEYREESGKEFVDCFVEGVVYLS